MSSTKPGIKVELWIILILLLHLNFVLNLIIFTHNSCKFKLERDQWLQNILESDYTVV